MSRENVERHRRVIEAYNAQDVEAFIALLACAAGEGPFRPPPAVVMGFFSLSGLRSALAQSRAT
jgi:hypothetical protein